MHIKGKRVLKNGVTAGYVKQRDGSWKWRFLSGPNKKKKRRQRGAGKCEGNIKIIRAHGSYTEGRTFILPSGCNYITLSASGKSTPRNIFLINLITNLYREGKYLFKNEDKSLEFSEAGIAIQHLLSTIYSGVNESIEIEIKNHVGDGIKKFNDINISFLGDGCDPTGNGKLTEQDMCGIDCISGNEMTSYKPIYHRTPMLLSQIINFEGNTAYDRYIFFACRPYSVPEFTGIPRMQRQISINRQNMEFEHNFIKKTKQKNKRNRARARTRGQILEPSRINLGEGGFGAELPLRERNIESFVEKQIRNSPKLRRNSEMREAEKKKRNDEFLTGFKGFKGLFKRKKKK